MRFAHVTGILFSDRDGYRLEVSIDDRKSVVPVRDERIPRLLEKNGTPDAWWTVDQFTQETIGTTLAEQGWEAVSEAEQAADAEFGLPTAVYVVRK